LPRTQNENSGNGEILLHRTDLRKNGSVDGGTPWSKKKTQLFFQRQVKNTNKNAIQKMYALKRGARATNGGNAGQKEPGNVVRKKVGTLAKGKKENSPEAKKKVNKEKGSLKKKKKKRGQTRTDPRKGHRRRRSRGKKHFKLFTHQKKNQF